MDENFCAFCCGVVAVVVPLDDDDVVIPANGVALLLKEDRIILL